MRAKNEHSVYQRSSDGLWCFSYHDPTGKRRTVARKNQADAIAVSKTIIAEIETGVYASPSTATVESWCREWLQTYHKPAVRPSSFLTDQAFMMSHIVPTLGHIKLQSLDVAACQRFSNDLAKDYAPATVNRIIGLLKTCMKQAVRNGLRATNPAQYVTMPKRTQKEIVVFTESEMEKLFSALPDTLEGRAIKFIFHTGLRVSECCGLRWMDVNMSEGFFKVMNSIDKLHNDSEPKTASGKREIPFDRVSREIIIEQKNVCSANGTIKYVFATPTGSPVDRANIGRTLRNACHAAGIPSRGIHAARHTFATMLTRSNVDMRTVSEMLGHSKVAFTLQVYAHSDLETKKNALDKIFGAM